MKRKDEEEEEGREEEARTLVLGCVGKLRPLAPEGLRWVVRRGSLAVSAAEGGVDEGVAWALAAAAAAAGLGSFFLGVGVGLGSWRLAAVGGEVSWANRGLFLPQPGQNLAASGMSARKALVKR